MDRLSARLPACNDPTRIFEGEVVEAGIALHGLSSLMMTCESTVTCSQIAALIEQVWSTANTQDDAIRVKRLSTEAQLDAAMKAGDRNKTRELFARLDALDEIKAGNSKAKSDRVELLRGDEITPEPISWLWPGWLARGKTHILAGPPGTGKTNLALAMTAAITRGGIMPDGSKVDPKVVVIWSGEDGVEDTLIPRLILNGADLSKVRFVRFIMTAKGANRLFDPGYDMPLLKQAILDSGDEVGMFLVDPVANVVVGDGNMNNQVRRAIQPLVELANETKCVALGITHLTKASGNRDPIDRLVGSVAFGGVARVVMIAVKMSADEGGGGLLVRVKSNIGPDEGGYRYHLEKDRLPTDDRIEATRVLYGDKLEGSPRDLLAMAESIPDAEERGAVAEAKEFVQQFLADGPIQAKELEQAAKAAGIARRTLERARKSIGVISRRGFDGNWRCYLPERKSVGEVGEVGEKSGQVRQNGVHVRQVRQAVGEVGIVINQEDNYMFAKSANFANISSNGEEPPPPELPTKPLSPLGRRIMKTVQATPAGLDTNELGRQVGNGKGASSLMVERELEELARCGLLARTNGRWVMTRVQS